MHMLHLLNLLLFFFLMNFKAIYLYVCSLACVLLRLAKCGLIVMLLNDKFGFF